MSPLTINSEAPFEGGDEDGPMPIAVVGMSFRGPGDAENLEGLWDMITSKREARTSIPKERWNHEAFYHPDSSRNGTTSITGGHFIKQDLSKFDAPFFSMTRTEAEALDPQQRLLLECSYEALETAGIPLEKVSGSETCVYVGSFCGDYTDMLSRDPDSMPFYQATSSGHSRAIISNRLSYYFNLRGPSATIDTACSSSLVALHLACQSLRTGETKQAIVAGANVILSHEMTISMTMMQFLSPDGRCYSFDERANGYSRGEGVGCVFLKPLEDAIRDGDPIRAVIRNTGSNQDGKTPGITLPSREAQEDLIRSVYAKARMDPLDTCFVECHGTGTPAGDPLETEALANVFTKGRSPEKPLLIGSVKTNIGHLEGASGVAGLIKAVLMLERGKILPNRNFERPSKRIHFAEWKLRVPTEVEDFPNSASTRVISVNSFGYGGSNAHAIVQGFDSYRESKGSRPLQANGVHGVHGVNSVNGLSLTNGDGHTAAEVKTNGHKANGITNGTSSTEEAQTAPSNIYLISALDSKSIQRQTAALADFLDRNDTADNEEATSKFLRDLAYTLSQRRTRLPTTLAVHARSRQELVSALRQQQQQTLSGVRSTKRPALAFVFTGQGAQWWGMGRELFAAFPIFAASIARCDEMIRGFGADWSLVDELLKDAEQSRINEPCISQPACTAVQIALVDLLASLGIRPVAVTGHSSGEIAAAYCAGAITAEDGMAIAYHRGVVSERLKDRCPDSGGMLAVGLSATEATDYIEQVRSKGKVTIACINSGKSLTISGDATGIEELKQVLDEKGIFARRLAVGVAYHSHHMSYVADEYLAAIAHIRPTDRDSGRDACSFYSAVTGGLATASDLGPEYWVENMLGQVKFESSFQAMCFHTTKSKGSTQKTKITAICEIGPHSALAGPMRQILGASKKLRDQDMAMLSCLVRNKDAETTFADMACRLIELGFPLDISRFNRSAPSLTRPPKVLTNLPSYRWDHETTYWAESRLSREYRFRPYARSDILGVPVAHFNASEPRWRNIIKTEALPWVKDHKIQGSIIYPAAGFLCMALEALTIQARERSVDTESVELREVSIGQALVVPDDSGAVEVILSMRPLSSSIRSPSDVWSEFSISSVSPDSRWTEHCRGLGRVVKTRKPSEVPTPTQLGAEKANSAEFVAEVDGLARSQVDPKSFYAHLCDLGLDYGPTFANIDSLCHGPNAATATISIAQTRAVMPNGFEYDYVLHPATLDSLFHPLFAAITGTSSKMLQQPFVPVLIDRLVMSTAMKTTQGAKLRTWTKASFIDNRQLSATSLVVDESVSTEEPVLSIQGLVCMKLAAEKQGLATGQESMHFAYETQWLPDIDAVLSSDLRTLCEDLKPTTEEKTRIDALEEAGFYLMKRALAELEASDIENSLPHHKRLYNCMKLRVQENEHVYEAAVDNTHIKELLDRVSTSGAEGRLLVHVGRNLVPIIQGRIDALETMLEDGKLSDYYRDNSRFARNYEQATRYLDLAGHKNPNMSILEIGSGTGGATLPALEALTDDETGLCRFGKFTFTDISTGFFEAAKEKFSRWSSQMVYAKLDIEVDPAEQGFETGEYDLILAANVLHATRSMDVTMANVRKLLKPGGKLVLVELTREKFTTSTIFGTLPGWFAGEESDRVRGPTLTEEKWHALLQRTGFNGLDAGVWDADSEKHHQGSMMTATAGYTAISNGVTETSEGILLIHENSAKDLPYAQRLRKWLEQASIPVSEATIESCMPEGKACIVLSELAGSKFRQPSDRVFAKIKEIFTTAKFTLWVTRGALMGSPEPTANMVTGFARTVRSEYGDNTVLTLDLDPVDSESSAIQRSVDAITTLLNRYYIQFEFTQDITSMDTEFAERSGKISIPRFVPSKSIDRSMSALLDDSHLEMVPLQQLDRKLVVEVGTPGLLDTIHFIDDVRVEPELPDNSVEIEVKATGLNFKDVMMAMGQIAVETLGGECSGIVRRVGKMVHNLKPGDRVSCYGFGTFANLVRQDAAAVQKIPDDMSFELAAALPVTFCTALYAVVHVARITTGKSVLIHAASGGLGQALIELCKMRGARIFCTVGTLEKKRLLVDSYGIPSEQVLNSRDASFAVALKRMTGGQGVDVVMNSVAGELLRVTWDCVAPFGTFIELGARDYTINSRLEMYKFARNVTFAAVNLVSLIRERPAVAAEVWRDVMALFRNDVLRGPTPLTTYGMPQLETALRLMQSGKHLGKIVLRHGEEDIVMATSAISAVKPLFTPSASYVLVGGMGGLGRAIALWMHSRGARNFIFASRSGLNRPEAQELKTALEASGSRVVVGECDVSKSSDLANLMSKASGLPPVKGVIQGAMVLQDALLSNMQLSAYEAIVKPKVEGTWNLHKLFEGNDLDFFVMLSSTSGLIGNASQAAYAASSTFLDAFATYRRSQGLAAATLDLGVIQDIGYVSENKNLATALEHQGFQGTTPDQLMALLQSAIVTARPSVTESAAGAQGTVARGHIVTGLGTWKESGALGAFDRAIFSHVRQMGRAHARSTKGDRSNEGGANALGTRLQLKSAKKQQEAVDIVSGGLVAKISSLSMIQTADISIDRPLSEFGMDSLVAVEMRNWIAREMDAAVPILELMANMPIYALAEKVLAKSRLLDLAALTS